MAYEMKDGGGTLHINKFKKDGDLAPDRRGTVMWRGELIEIAGWLKKDKNGQQFLSLKLQEPREKAAPPPKKSLSDDMDGEEIPF